MSLHHLFTFGQNTFPVSVQDGLAMSVTMSVAMVIAHSLAYAKPAIIRNAVVRNAVVRQAVVRQAATNPTKLTYNNERGEQRDEYALLLTFVLVAIVAMILVLGPQVALIYSEVEKANMS